MLLVRIGRVGADDADVMIGERGMHAGKLHRWHMAGDAILRGDWTGFARVVVRGFLRARRRVASEALVVVGGGIVVERLVRVVTGYACKARVAFAPAAAALQSIRLKAHVLHALNSGYGDFVPGTMTGPAKIHLRHRPQTPWVENGLAALSILFVVHELGMLGAGTMTSFAIHSEYEPRWIEPGPRCGSGGVAPKAAAQSIWGNRAPERLIQSLRRLGRVAGGQIQALQSREEAHAALVVRAVLLINVGLALVSYSKGPAERCRNGIGAVANAVVSGRWIFRDRKGVRPSLVRDPFVPAKRRRIGSQTGGARHGRFGLRGCDFGMAPRAFLGACEIVQGGRLLCWPPTGHIQPFVGTHRGFRLLLRRRMGVGGLSKEGARH